MAILVERENIGIFGRMNAGKSSVMNLITQQAASIVDEVPGTTADTKIALYELHGIGPVRILDTAGIDEQGELGEKKKKKAADDLKECNLVLLVIDPSMGDYSVEEKLLREARDLDCQVLVVYNLFSDGDTDHLDKVESSIELLRFHKKISIHADDETYRQPLVNFILRHFEKGKTSPDLLPFIEKDEYYVLVIPMDEETPSGRYLRPQAMTEEYITRHWAYPVSYRLDLGAARGRDPDRERARFDAFLEGLGKRPRCMITDSQAMDIMNSWCPDDVALTTFSIVMIQYMSGGRLAEFVRGAEALETLKSGDSILIAEACNHSRISEDIGTVQIPRIIHDKFPGVTIDHAFGREFQDNSRLGEYSLVIHCGGCMISRQKMTARIRDLEAVGVPFTNYGIFLSMMQGRDALLKVLKPWGI